MKRFSRRTWILLGVIAVVALAGAVSSFAFFTTTGSGTGTVTVGTPAPLTLSSGTVGNLFPGAPPTPVTITIENEGFSPVHGGTVTGSIDPASVPAGCDVTWFAVNGGTFNADIPAGGHVTVQGNIQMIESGTNQDGCEGAVLSIQWKWQ
jgi:hypothetical protein